MTCVRCGGGIFNSEDKVSLNKLWHRCCFTCFCCGIKLNKTTAKVYQDEIYCSNCLPGSIDCICERNSVKMLCQSSSTPSCDMRDLFKCDTTNCCRPNNQYCTNEMILCKKVHSCSCLPQKDPQHCFCYPIPREVANYYNRGHTKPCCLNCPYVSRKKFCFENIEDNCPPCIRRIKYHPCQKCCIPPCPKERRCNSPCCVKDTCSPVDVCYVKRKCKPQNCCGTTRKCCSPSRKCPERKCRESCPRECCPRRCHVKCVRNCSPCRSPCREICVKTLCCECCGKDPCVCRRYRNIMNVCCACCVRCGCKVYITERVVVSCGVYHVGCFSCYCCRKQLNLSTVYENCGEIYCKQCYNDSFGTKYYGYKI